MQPIIHPRRVADLSVLEIFPAQPAGPLPQILAVHGYSGRKEDLTQAGTLLAGQGYYVVAVDLHLHGEAGPSPFDPAATLWRIEEVIERSCDNLDALLAAYAAESGPADAARAGLLGISLGGAVTYRFLTRRAQGGIQASGVQAAVALIAGLIHIWPESLRRARPIYPYFKVSDELIRAYEERLQQSPQLPFLSGVVDFPLLMQYGQEDPIVPVEAVREAYAAVHRTYTQPERLQMIEYPGCTHETPPEMYARALEWFGRYI